MDAVLRPAGGLGGQGGPVSAGNEIYFIRGASVRPT